MQVNRGAGVGAGRHSGDIDHMADAHVHEYGTDDEEEDDDEDSPNMTKEKQHDQSIKRAFTLLYREVNLLEAFRMMNYTGTLWCVFACALC